MPSRSLHRWHTHGRRALDEIEAAHRAVGRKGPGARYAAQQVTQAYVVLLSSQFQLFCRDLNTECIGRLLEHPSMAPFESILFVRFTEGRKLETGNPNPGNIGSDFNRLGIKFWTEVRHGNPRAERHQGALEELNRWRNAVAHQDFRNPVLNGRSTVTLHEVRRWRVACNALAMDFDRVMRTYLHGLCGKPPW
jgi:hypothetical protein